MKITVFTGNQPRHISLIEKLAGQGHEVFACIENNTVFPGVLSDFYPTNSLMHDYFVNVRKAEFDIFGRIRAFPKSVRILTNKSGDLNNLDHETLSDFLNSDTYIVFGSSYIKSWLVDFLIQHRAINIHMGLSPYYRGSSCNFWALFDQNPSFVGSTLHLLGKGLDSGDIISQEVAELRTDSVFHFTMGAVQDAQNKLLRILEDSFPENLQTIPQDKKLEIRYSRYSDFDEEALRKFNSMDFSKENLTKLYRKKSPKILITN